MNLHPASDAGGLSTDHVMLRDMVRDFARAEVDAAAIEEGLPAKLLGQLRELGLFGMLAPESLGGAAMDLTSAVLAVEALARADGGLGLVLAEHTACMARAIAANDSGAIRAMAQGGLGVIAEGPVNVLCQQPGGADLVWRRGAVVTPVERAAVKTLGFRSAGAESMRFERACPASADPTRLVLRAAVAVGLGRAALDAGVAYSLERQQFGKPISAFQGVQWMIAESATEVDAAGLLVLDAVQSKGSMAQPAAVAFVQAARAAKRAADDAVQMHGGYGFTTEYPVERILRDASVLEAEVHEMRSALGRELVA